MAKFEETAIRYFTKNGVGVFQRIDAINCFSPLSKFWFWHLRLKILVARKVISKKKFGSIWASCRNMPWYGISKKDQSHD